MIVPQIIKGFMNALFVEGIEQDALDRFRIMNIIEDFIDKKLSLSIGVTGIDNRIGFFDEAANRLELVLTVRTDQQLPRFWNNRQIFCPPCLVSAIVILWFGLLQDMTVCPGDDTATGFDEAIPSRLRSWKALGELTSHTRLFRYKQFHYIPYLYSLHSERAKLPASSMTRTKAGGMILLSKLCPIRRPKMTPLLLYSQAK